MLCHHVADVVVLELHAKHESDTTSTGHHFRILGCELLQFRQQVIALLSGLSRQIFFQKHIYCCNRCCACEWVATEGGGVQEWILNIFFPGLLRSHNCADRHHTTAEA